MEDLGAGNDLQVQRRWEASLFTGVVCATEVCFHHELKTVTMKHLAVAQYFPGEIVLEFIVNFWIVAV